MNMIELGLVLLLVTIIATFSLERDRYDMLAVREVTALRNVQQFIQGNIKNHCNVLLNRVYSNLDELRAAMDWHDSLDTITEPRDWRIEIGRAPLNQFTRIRVRYPNIQAAQAVSNTLGAYSQTYITTATNGADMSWVSPLDSAALEHSHGLQHYRHYGKAQAGLFADRGC